MAKYSLGWHPDKPDKRDFKYKVTRAISLPPTSDLRKWMPKIWDQGDLGSCTGQAIAAAMQFDAIKLNRPWANVDRSRLFIYYNERVIEGTVGYDAGAEIRDGIKAVGTNGACAESLWWYNTAKFAVKPNKRCYADAIKHKATNYYRVNQSPIDIRTCLHEGFPIVFGVTCYDSFLSEETAQTGIIPMPGNDESVQGGHAILLCGYNDSKKLFTFRNSWGTGWGDAGYGYLPYSYVLDNNMADDFWTIRFVN